MAEDFALGVILCSIYLMATWPEERLARVRCFTKLDPAEDGSAQTRAFKGQLGSFLTEAWVVRYSLRRRESCLGERRRTNKMRSRIFFRY